MSSITNFLKVISDKNRLIILYVLNKNTLCVCDIQKLISLTQGALSIQLKNLVTTGLLESFKQGKWVFYKLDKNIPEYQLNILNELFKQIDKDEEVQQIISKLEISEICKI
ncbi:ArsR/SmtB family transcription factor [Francisella philomiragia]|uniref:Bacterial regulatory, arsR family protein n=1 Tax=Francisella philomiragia TaxID=28110 RepID=A0AAW3DE82_9GAMM|nr:metalloregulator ArsR/SmtB family transcription factor [Francisella philomiragia]AJI75717.1 bacterial regulatory, arsR family protein [Francisella philomiragia subsp. philomiragia ATCC 25015]EET21570.1 transcriptional regulator [Francisella philomiragia subsp. philomiragia ATCC 25015]KFJ43829.1 bacterial regulatory, arsR family protein [Francisella philomiragia]MBK2095104.1 winged helix-turn-helix transcriptional regulator [Francisella philomiragia]MBK2237999.1 winged helix-turn-helix trans